MHIDALKRVTKTVAPVLLLAIIGLVTLIVPDYRWRAIVVARKLTGLLQSVSWRDLGDIARPGSGFVPVSYTHLTLPTN